MPEFLKLLSPAAALEKWMAHLPSQVADTEIIETAAGMGRTTAGAIHSPESLPSFPRSTVDGFAVRAADTFGASETLPAYLNLTGEVPMGKTADIICSKGQAVRIHTGGMLPEGADAVVMLEYTQETRPAELEILHAVGVGENILKIGEDVVSGQEVLPAGTVLGPAEIGGLIALGLITVPVARQPRVGIISSGDEIVPPHQPIEAGQVRDINSYSLSALVSQSGGVSQLYGIVPDKAELLEATLRQALDECDLVVVTAGSSASARDLTAEVIDRMGEPGVLVHGVNVKPGKPSILAVCGKKAVIGLPGNPVSALVIARLFVIPAIDRLLGKESHLPRHRMQARLAVNLSSQAGREDFVPVILKFGPEGWLADPIFYKSNLIFTLVQADGLARIPADATGVPAGALVEVEIIK